MKSPLKKPNWYEEHLNRIGQNHEDAICGVATGLAPMAAQRWTTDEAVAHTELAVRTFNWHADRLDYFYGFPTRLKRSVGLTSAGDKIPTVACTVGHSVLRRSVPPTRGSYEYRWAAESDASPLDVRRALGHSKCKLFWLSSSRSTRSPAIDWMLDLLTIIQIPPFERPEGVTTFPRGHIWHRKLRKTEKGRRYLEAGILLDQRTKIAEDQRMQFRRELFRRQARLDRLVVAARKIDPTDLDRYVVNWPHHIVGHQYGIGVLVPINEPHIIVDPLAADCDALDDGSGNESC